MKNIKKYGILTVFLIVVSVFFIHAIKADYTHYVDDKWATSGYKTGNADEDHKVYNAMDCKAWDVFLQPGGTAWVKAYTNQMELYWTVPADDTFDIYAYVKVKGYTDLVDGYYRLSFKITKISGSGPDSVSVSDTWTTIPKDELETKSVSIDQVYLYEDAVYRFDIKFTTHCTDTWLHSQSCDFDSGARKVNMWKVFIDQS